MYVEKDAHSFSKLPIAVCTLAYLLNEIKILDDVLRLMISNKETQTKWSASENPNTRVSWFYIAYRDF